MEVVGLSGMPLLGERDESHSCDVPRVDERDTLAAGPLLKAPCFICSAFSKIGYKSGLATRTGGR